MEFEQVRDVIKGVPFMSEEQGKMIYDFVRASGVRECLELGIGHGVGSCYIGAALQETGGRLMSIDRTSAKEREPNVETLLKRAGLESIVTPVYEPNSYTWALLRMIEEHSEDGLCTPCLDFCFVDGAHLFEPDACAFFLADKLLKPGGWLLFDDLFWTIGSSEFAQEEWAAKLSAAEREQPHILKVYDVLVKQHPGYGDFRITGQWGWARKQGGGGAGNALDAIGAHETLKGYLKRYLRPWKRRLKKLAGFYGG